MAVQAFLAGNDMLVVSDFEPQIAAFIAALKDQTIPEQSINESVLRILRWKLSLQLLK